MRHGVAASHFNRDSKSRKALFKNLVRSLVENGELETTIEKAKAVKKLADRMIHRALVDSVANRRLLHRFFGRRDVVNTLVERIAPAMKGRTSGFTRVSKVGLRRGDNATVAKLSLVAQPEKVGSLSSGKPAPKRAAKPKAAKAEKPVAKKVAAQSTKATAAKPAAKPVEPKKEAVKKAPAKKAVAAKKTVKKAK
jgi:large subunit ribosomal protein L17